MSEIDASLSDGNAQQHLRAVVAAMNALAEFDNVMKKLQHTGFDMTKLSVVEKNRHAEESVIRYFYSVGIPKGDLTRYETSLQANKFQVVVHGSAAEISQARDIMQGANAAETTMPGPVTGMFSAEG